MANEIYHLVYPLAEKICEFFPFVTRVQSALLQHIREEHDKDVFFKCSKCACVDEKSGACLRTIMCATRVDRVAARMFPLGVL